MATKFSQLYKQELKSQGILSSLGSAALKQTRQRMDIRNTLFGGSGVLSLAGQKIFGKGYSPLEKASSVLSSSPTSTSSGADSQGITDLLASSERQEALLRVISKNTFNMNLMARDTNITRQNIVTLTKKMTGRSSKSQDALWYDVKTRNTAIDALAKKRNENTQPGNTAPSNMGGSSFMVLVKFLYIDSVEEVVRLFEVEIQKLRNLSVHESEECEHGEGVCVYPTLL